ncbi:MAG: hypothetical protein ABFQ65_02100 [Nanoarchaeota archaeon]
MNKNKIFLIGIFIILVTTLFVSADYSVSTPQLTKPGLNSANYNYGTKVQLSPLDTDSNRCERGQDFLIQVAPFGCTPAVVRSDLLEEQNVPVFCQLAATQINPLIEVDAINYISFKGKMPEGVSGVGFHPAQAAIDSSRGTLLNSPVLENVGYAVIVLEKQKNESAMPDSIEGTLTANIKYNVQNTFGVGKATYYLPEFTEADWETKFNQYGFWRNKGYLRADSIDTNSATISVYSDTNNKITTTTLAKGKTSSQINLPGFYCLAGMSLRLDSLENPITRAKLNINGEIVEVGEGEKFLENRCSVADLEKRGLVQETSIRCKSDDRVENFNLRISPKVNLEINEVVKDYSVGDYLYVTSDNEKAVYLGYIGTKKDSENLEDTYIILMSKPVHTSALSESELVEVTNFDRLTRNSDLGVGVFNVAADFIKLEIAGASRIIKYFGKGKSFAKISYDKFSVGTTFQDSKVKIIGFAEPRDTTLEGDAKKNYDFAMADYRKIIDSFPNTQEILTNSSEEKILEEERTFGEQAFFSAIQLAKITEQKKTMLSLCHEFKEKFPESKIDLSKECNSPYKNSNTELSTQNVLINNKIKSISFEGIYEPSFKEFSAIVRVRNASGFSEQYELTKDTPIYLTNNTNEFIELKNLEQGYAIVRVHILPKGVLSTATNFISSDNKKLIKNQGVGVGGFVFTVTDINLKKVAKVSVLPKIDNAGTEANFSFNIGIEKRAIQLAPDVIEDRIEDLENIIEDWSEISSDLGNTVKTFNAACLSMGIYLTAKNFFDNSGGKSIARNKVMRSEGGWTDICKEKVAKKEFSSLDDCFLENAEDIDADVENYYGAIENIKITEENKDTETSLLAGSLEKDGKIINPQNPTELVDTKNIVTSFNYKGENNTIQISQVRDLKAIETALKNNPSKELKNLLNIQKYKILSDIDVNVQDRVIQKSLLDEISGKEGISSEGSVGIYYKKDSIQGVYDGRKTTKAFGEISTAENPIKPIQIITYSGGKYILELEKIKTREYTVKDVYNLDGTRLTSEKPVTEFNKEKYDVNAEEIKRTFRFKEFDKSTYQNKFKDSEIKYFETEPYKGMPAQVPFDLQNGWYAAMKQTLATGGQIRTYDASGAVSSFYLCNVGENGKAEFNSGIRDDICQGYNSGTGQIVGEFPGLTKSETDSLVKKSISAISDAKRGYKSGVTSVNINRLAIKVGNPEVGVPEMQCQDFMSPKDCNILFNVCDPVVCPSSRCNLGGTHYVSDVVQSGIIGSIALCLPNLREKIFVPICLTGLKAGIDRLLDMFSGYRDCLQTQLDSGETVGICDELHSIYLCEFFWEQALPFTETIIPRMFEFLLGQEGTRGGGEYLGVQSAWDNAQNSVDYMSNYYGRDITNAFKVKLTQEVGGAVCKNFISANYPAGGEILDSLIEPASPPQYTAYFNEIPFTTATVPATSQYKVFYSISAGKESKAYYRVYLKTPSGTSLYQTNPTLDVASGFINRGDYVDKSPDFTAPTGYKELCISINGKENCGFKKVSTSFAVDYLEDKYLEEQASQTDIKSQVDCVSGTPSLYSFAQPNIQEGISEAINPALYDRGIIRVCGTENPGKGTDVNWETKDAQWIQVGNCDGERGNLKCWLNRKSVTDNIKTTDIEEAVLNKTSKNYVDSLLSEGNYLDFSKTITEIYKLDSTGKTNYITDTLIGKAFFNNQKAKLYLIRGNAYTELAEKIYKLIKKTPTGQTNLDVIFQNCKGQYDGQCDVAKGIVKIAREIKTKNNIDDTIVKSDTDADCFEQLVLMLAMQESGVSHCRNKDRWANGKDFVDDLTCDGDSSWVLKAKGENSLGVMQINTDAHPNANDMEIFESNVRYGIEYLIQNYNIQDKQYDCKSESYSGWKRALRFYNGWNTNCSKGDVNYVGNVLGQKYVVESFGDVCDATIIDVSQIETLEEVKKIITDEDKEFMSFEFQDNKIDTNILYNYTKEGWKSVKDIWQPAIDSKNWKNVDKDFNTNEANQNLIKSLIGQQYKEGLKLLINKIISIDGSDLVTEKVEFSSEGIFTFIQIRGERVYFRFDEKENIWKIRINEFDYSKGNLNSALINKWIKYSEINTNENTGIAEGLNLLKSLENTDFYEGAIIIFDVNEELIRDRRDFDEVNVPEEYNAQTALDEINSEGLSGSYYENEDFFDKLLADEVLTFDEHNSITFLYGEEDIDELKKLLEKKLGKNIETRIWTVEEAYREVSGLRGKYSDNKKFIDELCSQNILTEDECNEIIGEGLFNIEEDMSYVRKLLIAKEISE